MQKITFLCKKEKITFLPKFLLPLHQTMFVLCAITSHRFKKKRQARQEAVEVDGLK